MEGEDEESTEEDFSSFPVSFSSPPLTSSVPPSVVLLCSPVSMGALTAESLLSRMRRSITQTCCAARMNTAASLRMQVEKRKTNWWMVRPFSYSERRGCPPAPAALLRCSATSRSTIRPFIQHHWCRRRSCSAVGRHLVVWQTWFA